MQIMAVFITGTDTNVGKTITSGLLLKKYSKLLPDIRYWKPIQTGYPPDDDSKIVQNISGVSDNFILQGIKFKYPYSPHYAAELENAIIDIHNLKIQFKEYSQRYRLIIEGAGGIYVPLTRNYFWIDWIHELQLPVLIVARSTLGTINHTLLTIQALKNRNITIIGIFFCGEQELDYIKDNKRTINEITQLPIHYFDYFKDKEIDPDPNHLLLPHL